MDSAPRRRTTASTEKNQGSVVMWTNSSTGFETVLLSPPSFCSLAASEIKIFWGQGGHGLLGANLFKGPPQRSASVARVGKSWVASPHNTHTHTQIWSMHPGSLKALGPCSWSFAGWPDSSLHCLLQAYGRHTFTTLVWALHWHVIAWVLMSCCLICSHRYVSRQFKKRVIELQFGYRCHMRKKPYMTAHGHNWIHTEADSPSENSASQIACVFPHC